MTVVQGVYAGIVVSTQDPQNRRRVRMRIPQLTGTAVSGWAEPVSFGTVAPGDQVTVAFEGGDANRPLYWPQVTETVAAWTPLALEPGWVASDAGSPVARATEDGMIELAGSVETSSITVGSAIKFATLPGTLRPLHTVRATGATVYRSAYRAKTVFGEYRATTSTTSSTYVTDTNGPTVDFISPGSGQVVITWGAYMKNAVAGSVARMGVRVLNGATVVVDGDDNRCAEVLGTNQATASMARTVTGLNPGTTYTVVAIYHTDTTTSASGTFDNKWITVTPTTPDTTPMARISMDTSGSLSALFPDGAASPYATSLAGIRARAV